MSLELLFKQALAIEQPWEITGVTFDPVKKRHDIKVDFVKGSTFGYTHEYTRETKEYKAYDTIEKTWRHTNYLEHECYLKVRTPRIILDSGGIKLIAPPWSVALLDESFFGQLPPFPQNEGL